MPPLRAILIIPNMESLQRLAAERVEEALQNHTTTGEILRFALLEPLQELFDNGSHLISCEMGCSACCKRLVFSTRLEARAVAEQLISRPEKAAELLPAVTEHARLVTRFLEQTEEEELDALWFLGDIPCPLLEKSLCQVHEIRPLLCALRHSLSPPEQCETPENDVEMLGEVDQALPLFEQILEQIADRMDPSLAGYGPFTSLLLEEMERLASSPVQQDPREGEDRK